MPTAPLAHYSSSQPGGFSSNSTGLGDQAQANPLSLGSVMQNPILGGAIKQQAGDAVSSIVPQGAKDFIQTNIKNPITNNITNPLKSAFQENVSKPFGDFTSGITDSMGVNDGLTGNLFGSVASKGPVEMSPLSAPEGGLGLGGSPAASGLPSAADTAAFTGSGLEGGGAIAPAAIADGTLPTAAFNAAGAGGFEGAFGGGLGMGSQAGIGAGWGAGIGDGAVGAGLASSEAAGGAAMGSSAAAAGGTAAAETGLATAGAANAWNPVGWGLLAAAAVYGIGSMANWW